jgi:hypothetical protein
MTKTKDATLEMVVGGQAFSLSGTGLPPGPVEAEMIWPASVQVYDLEVGSDGVLDVRGSLPETHRGAAMARLYALDGPVRGELIASTSAEYEG